MTVSATPSTTAQVIASAAGEYIKQTTGSGTGANGTSSALQEASETPAVTAKEAAKGDVQAKRLLARQQQEQQLQEPAPAKEPGKGDLIDQNA